MRLKSREPPIRVLRPEQRDRRVESNPRRFCTVEPDPDSESCSTQDPNRARSPVALSADWPYYRNMIKNAKKTEAEKQLIKFRNQFHNLLIKYPEIRVCGDINGDVLAFIPEGDRPRVYLPTSGKQELITQFALGK